MTLYFYSKTVSTQPAQFLWRFPHSNVFLVNGNHGRNGTNATGSPRWNSSRSTEILKVIFSFQKQSYIIRIWISTFGTDGNVRKFCNSIRFNRRKTIDGLEETTEIASSSSRNIQNKYLNVKGVVAKFVPWLISSKTEKIVYRMCQELNESPKLTRIFF